MFEYQRTFHGTITILALRGNLDALNSQELRSTLETFFKEGCRALVLDVSRLDLIDSSGTGTLIMILKRMRRMSPPGQVVLVGMQGQPLQIFQLLRLHKDFELVSTIEQAIARLESHSGKT